MLKKGLVLLMLTSVFSILTIGQETGDEEKKQVKETKETKTLIIEEKDKTEDIEVENTKINTDENLIKQTDRRRIVTAEDIEKRRSAFGNFLMKPFRSVAPVVTNRITTFEEGNQSLILVGPRSKPIRPQFGGVSEDSGFGLGLAASTIDYLSKDFRIVGSALVSTKNYARTNIGFELTPQKFKKNNFIIKLIGEQLLLAEEDFYGSGANSIRDNETSYYQRKLGAKLTFDYDFSKDLKFGLFSEASKNDITEGGGDTNFVISDIFNSQTLSGFDRNIRLWETGAFVQTHMLDEVENPHSGWSAKFSFSTADSLGRSDFGWQNFGIDARTYLPLGNKLRVIALRFIGDFKDPKGNSAVPFFKLAKLGNRETLRGYDTFRFQGNSRMHLNLEYRFKLMQGFETNGFTGVEGVFFGDFGQVYNNYDELNWDNLRATWGGGIRITTRTSVAFTLLYAQSPERAGIFWRFGRTF